MVWRGESIFAEAILRRGHGRGRLAKGDGREKEFLLELPIRFY